jgi:hypothetical protein
VENVLAFLGGLVPRLTLVYYSRTLLWHGVPLHMRRKAEEMLVLKPTLSAGEAVSVVDSLGVLLGATVMALAAGAVLVHLLEFRGKNLQPG